MSRKTLGNRKAISFLFSLTVLIPYSNVLSQTKSIQTQGGGKTLELVRKNKELKCGVNTGLAGFASPGSDGKWKGLDVDVCRAVFTAIFPNSKGKKITFVPLSAQQRFVAIQSGEVDILSRNTTWTLSRDTKLGLNFAPVTYYDGQGFIVRKKDGITSALQMKKASVCTQQGTTTELNLADYSRANKLEMKVVVFENKEETWQAFVKKRCDAYTTDASGLAAERSKMKNPADYLILPEIISKEPLAPAVRHGDDRWFDILKWTVNSLIAAEELGITSKNIDSSAIIKSKDPKIKRFLGVTAGNGASLGLDEKWAYRVIKEIGNYGEIFERNVGMGSALKLERGLNALWTAEKRGLMYSPPLK